MSNCCNSLKINTVVAKNSPMEYVNKNSELPVAIIGAGPIGLAAAAHLVSKTSLLFYLSQLNKSGEM